MDDRDWFAAIALLGLLASIEKEDKENWDSQGLTNEQRAEMFARDAFMTGNAMFKEKKNYDKYERGIV